MLCKNCGERLSENAKFCPVCRAAIAEETDISYEQWGFAGRQGFSEKINDPVILAAVKKSNKASGILGLILIPLPVIIAFILGAVDNDFSYLAYGLFVSLIFFISSFIYYLGMKFGKQWDGVVVDKTTETHMESNEDSAGSSYTLYVVKIKKDRGGIKKLKEREYNIVYYDYLNIGDRVRCHPQFNYYYEKYDKSRDSYAICPVCSTKNPIEKTKCSRCGVPVIK